MERQTDSDNSILANIIISLMESVDRLARQDQEYQSQLIELSSRISKLESDRPSDESDRIPDEWLDYSPSYNSDSDCWEYSYPPDVWKGLNTFVTWMNEILETHNRLNTYNIIQGKESECEAIIVYGEMAKRVIEEFEDKNSRLYRKEP